MKYNYYMIFFILFIFLLYKIDAYYYNNKVDKHIIIKSIVKTLDIFYPKKINIDNKFSKNVYITFFENLDPLKIYLTKEDIDLFSFYEKKLDNFFIKGDLSFFNNTIKFLYKKIYYLEYFYYKILEKPFNFKLNHKIFINKKNSFFSKNDKELKNRIRLYLKYLTIIEMDSYINQYYIKKSYKYNLINVEKIARKIVFNKIKDKFRKLKIKKKSEWFSTYINSNIIQYDPHTIYFSEKEKKIFDVSISGQLEGIGVELEDIDGCITITNCFIGGPAWKSKKIKIGDIIIKVSQDNKKQINVEKILLDECVNYIRGKKGTKVFLTLKNKNGNIKKVVLIRNLIEQKELFTKSVLILDKKNKKYGLINIPEFYINYNNLNGRNSFKDVKYHLELLKKNNIDGLIIDLRNNGGGSLDSVINILGLFIKNGPILQIKNINGTKEIFYTDINNYIWNGPLIIIVNKLTASASEIFSSTIKDYNRGIIVGDSNTYGKGTVQTIYPLNKMFNIKNNIGFLKFTISKFYGVNGNSIQLKGVDPDIIIPYDYIYDYNYHLDDDKEINQKTSMSYHDVVTPVLYKPYSINNKNTLISKSNNRIKKNKNIKKIYNIINNYKILNKKSFINLNWKKFNNDKKNIYYIINNIDYLNKLYISKLKFFDSKNNCLINNINEKNNNNFFWYKSLKKDFSIEESINILNDYIIKNKQ